VEYIGVIENGVLMLEARLDDIKSNFRLITAAGNRLPSQTSEQILSVEVEQNFYRYVVTKDADGFIAKLTGDGATITNVATLSLREIFLRLVRKE
jgi:hypothetical protein